MSEHEQPMDDSEGRRSVPAGERGLTPVELLASLSDRPPTMGDVRMLMELRVSLRADPAGPARVVDCGVPRPLDPETAALLNSAARARLRKLSRNRPGDGGAIAEDRP